MKITDNQTTSNQTTRARESEQESCLELTQEELLGVVGGVTWSEIGDAIGKKYETAGQNFGQAGEDLGKSILISLFNL
ncbi:hypothetical protein SD80_007010 [Scytonema tolypothrichoides VB-61278]|nr:hypothetical protein SD80_007010 [Scytonema tolypothrichoides VB-61278]